MIWQTYLKTASAALFGTRHGKTDNPHRKSDALNRLKQFIGLILLDESYFTNAEYISHDLKEFAREGDMTVGELSTSKYQNNINARIYTGVDITWRTYLYNA